MFGYLASLRYPGEGITSLLGNGPEMKRAREERRGKGKDGKVMQCDKRKHSPVLHM